MTSPKPPRPLWRTYLAFVGPMVLANILQGLSGTLNGIFIGQMLGTQALAAVAGMFPVVFFFVSLVIGLGAGGSVLIGQAWGAREPGKVKAIAGTALSLGAAIGVVAAIFGSIFAHEILQVLDTPEAVLDEATTYMRVMMLTMPLLLVFILFTQLLRGVGDTVTPLLALTVSTVAGLVLTPALIKGWLGLPQLGVVSAAVASVVSFAIALGFLVIYLNRRHHPLAVDGTLMRALRIDPKLLAATLKIGVPTGVQMVVISIAGLVILGLVNAYGASATAAYGAVTQIFNYVQFPALSIAITASILGAQSIGAGRSNRLGAIVRTGFIMTLAITGGLVLIGYALSDWLLGWFLTDQPTLVIAERLLHLILWSNLVFGFQAVLAGVMRSSGTVMMPTTISIVSILVVQLPVARLLSSYFGLDGVWMAIPVAFCVMLLLQGTYYRLVWRHKRIERLI